MANYKITNITNTLHKRDAKFNMPVDIEYVDGKMKKSIRLEAGRDLFLSITSMPLSIHRLRIKKLIEVTEVSTIEPSKPKQQKEPKNEVVEDKTTSKPSTKSSSSTSRKTSTTKKSGTTTKKTAEELDED